MFDRLFNGKWTRKLINVLIWVSGYLNFVAFVIVGGFAVVKGDDEQKLVAKKVFVITLIFLALNGIMSFLGSTGAWFGNYYYSSWFYDFQVSMTRIINMAETITFATFIILELLKKEDPLTAEDIYVDHSRNEL